MGCWNATCMLSNLPITAGEEVRVVLLQKSYKSLNAINNNGYTYPSDIFSPAFLPFKAKYNDYGSVEEIEEDWNTEIIKIYLYQNFSKKIKTYEAGEIENYDLEQLIDGIERGGCRGDKDAMFYWGKGKDPLRTFELMMQNSLGEGKAVTHSFEEGWWPFALSFVLIREDVWQATLKQMRETPCFWNPAGGKPYYVTGQAVIDHRKTPYLKYVKKIAKATTEETKLSATINGRSHDTDLWHRVGGEARGLLAENYYNQAVISCIEMGKDPQKILGHWDELYLIYSAMNLMRKGWMVQTGNGGQDSEWKLYRQFAQNIIEICDAKIKEEDSWEEEDEEEA